MSKDNLKIVLRERGKLVTTRESHNIWVNQGRQFLTQVVSYTSYSPLVFQQTHLPQFIGFGIGGKGQDQLGVANIDPCLSQYPGGNSQSGIDATVERLERPVRVDWVTDPPSPPSGSPGSYVYDVGDVWLVQLTPTIHPTNYSVEWSHSFSETDFSRSIFLSVPLSEIGLFLAASPPEVYNNTLIAYDTFSSIPKTNNFSMDVTWQVRF